MSPRYLKHKKQSNIRWYIIYSDIQWSFPSVLQNNSDKPLLYVHRDWMEDQWDKIKDPEMNPQSYGHLIFEKGGKTI